MMVRVPSCNIDRPIYIWRMEIKLKDTFTPLHICRQGLPSFILISNKPHCWAINKRKPLEQTGLEAAAGVVNPHASAQSDHQPPPHPTPLHLISYFSRYH